MLVCVEGRMQEPCVLLSPLTFSPLLAHSTHSHTHEHTYERTYTHFSLSVSVSLFSLVCVHVSVCLSISFPVYVSLIISHACTHECTRTHSSKIPSRGHPPSPHLAVLVPLGGCGERRRKWTGEMLRLLLPVPWCGLYRAAL